MGVWRRKIAFKRVQTDAGGLDEKLRRGVREVRKRLKWAAAPQVQDPKILFVLGCQRSGTTLVKSVFKRDLDAFTIGEFQLGAPDDPEGLRLVEPAMVMAYIRRRNAPFAVLKPLVESQNALRLLAQYEHSSILWVYRDYADVSLSNLRFFGEQNPSEDLRPILEDDRTNWRCEGLEPAFKERLRELAAKELTPIEAGILFWCARNVHFVTQDLATHPRVICCRYETLVRDPETGFREIYRRIGRPFPGARVVAHVHCASVRSARGIDISPRIRAFANGLLDVLDAAAGYERSGSRTNA
jgi:hypothetical protein